MPQIKSIKQKAGRRGNNEGSIFQRKDGRWSGEVIVGYKTDGKPDRKTVYGKTRQEAAQQVAALTAEVFKNGYTLSSARRDLNFQSLCMEWYDLFEAPRLADATVENRRRMMKLHIFAAFGRYDVKDIDENKLQRFFNAKAKSGLSSDYIGKMKYLLNNFFRYATKKHYVGINPMIDVVTVKNDSSISKDRSGMALKPELRQAVLDMVENHKLLKPILITCTLTGLRPQEVLALTWDNIDFTNKTLSVKKAVNKKYQFDADWNVIARSAEVGKTKTPKSVRCIAMPEIVAYVLNEWLLTCKESGLKSDFVFPNTKTGKLRTYSGLRSLLERFKKRHKLQDEGISMYTLRHTFATILLEERENPKIVAELMGHTKVSTTLDLYSHVVSNAVYTVTAQTLDGVYSRITQKKNPSDSLIV